jgi:hypothetical protein
MEYRYAPEKPDKLEYRVADQWRVDGKQEGGSR